MRMTIPTDSLTIGAVAKRAGVPIDTIRYYEREGLLPEPLRRASGYRSYNESAVSRLRFIRRAKDLGFTLEEIRDLLALSADRHRGVKAVRQRAQERLASIDARIAELSRIRKGLEQLIDACPGRGDPEQCPILRALAEEMPQA
jgi:MerR family transcriptional regulator, copper efflux regulator